MRFDVNTIRNDFPILTQQVYGKQLIYLDNAATTQKPQSVIDTLNTYYKEFNSNVHRGVHYLSQKATIAIENARKTVQRFIHAKNEYEIIFTRGTTESVNLVASCYGKKFIGEGDEVIISTLEHHSNIVPWQMICEEKKAILKVIPINDNGEIIFEEFEKLISDKTKIIAVTYVSNALGTINPVKKIIELAHLRNIPVLLDGAQSTSHMKIDVQELDCDFYCFSGHKLYGPTGIGVLYGKEKWLNEMPPYQGGGEMIKLVTFEKTTFNELPFKFEAGTPHISGVLGLEAAIQYIEKVGIDKIGEYENGLLDYATEKLVSVDGLKIYGTAKEKTSVISFLIGKIHPFDAGTIIDKFGIAVRTGHHCTQPLMQRFGITGTIRASFAFYNTKEEIDILLDAVNKAKKMLQ